MVLLLGLGLGTAALAGESGPAPAREIELHEQLQSAVWPADIVRLADQLLSMDPAADWVPETKLVRQRAAAAAQLLRSNAVHLQRSAFASRDLPADRQQDLHRAALGDRESALRLARLYQHGSGSVAPDPYRYLGWLQYAALLGNDSASYEVALYYRKEGQPAMAAIYETRAVDMGYVVPAGLDNIRK